MALLYIGGDANYFPTYEQSAEKIAAVEAAVKEDSNPAGHYDATREVRPQGAGFYQFSKDEETRQKQMEELRRSRMETGKAREESGAAAGVEVRPGLEKRKREIEERRKAIEAKRRKVKVTSSIASKDSTAVAAEASEGGRTTSKRAKSKTGTKENQSQPQSADEFLAALERDLMAAEAKGA
jgi:coiled-coil domain-containing protein 174